MYESKITGVIFQNVLEGRCNYNRMIKYIYFEQTEAQLLKSFSVQNSAGLTFSYCEPSCPNDQGIVILTETTPVSIEMIYMIKVTAQIYFILINSEPSV